MAIERELAISVLKLTSSGPVSHEVINKDAKIPYGIARKLLTRLQNDGLINVRGGLLETDDSQRLKLAVYAIELGADVERVSGFLQWHGFENMAAAALERNGYRVTKNLRHRSAGHRWETDIVACKKPLALCIDCKHWKHGMSPSALKKIVEEQVERTAALARSMPNSKARMECASWASTAFVPAVLSLVTPRFKFYNDVPIISVLQLQDFLNQLPAYLHVLKHFKSESIREL